MSQGQTNEFTDVICATMYLMKPRELVMAATSEVTFDLVLPEVTF